MENKELKAGTVLQSGKYTIERTIGSGGFGITYYARHNVFGHHYAIKEFFISGYTLRNTANKTIMLQGMDETTYEKYLQKFIDEAATLARLDHPNIVKVTDIFRENGTAYIVMNFVEGQTLQQIVEQKGKLDYETAVNYIAQIAEAVEYIHEKDILHRDIKPENIIVTPKNKAVLIDFGSAREFVHDKTQKHTSILTEGYAPPEQYSSTSRKGAYSDIYSLGATFYFALTGQRPTEAAARTMETMPEPRSLVPTIPEKANSTIMKAMELRPEKRQQRVGEFMEDLLNSRGTSVNPEKVAATKSKIQPNEYIEKVRDLNTYHCILWIILWMAGSALSVGIGGIIVSLPLVLYQFGIKGFAKIFKSLQPIWVIIPSLIYFIICWLVASEYTIRDFLEGDDEKISVLFIPLGIYAILYTFFMIGRQLKIINGLERKIINKILNALILFITDIVISVVSSLLIMALVVFVVFVLKPHHLYFALPIIGIITILIMLFLQFKRNIIARPKNFIIASIITAVLSVLVWFEGKSYDKYKPDYSDGFTLVGRYMPNYDFDHYHTDWFYGLVDKKGKAITKIKYGRIEPFSEGLAAVCISESDKDPWNKKDKWGFIDKTGKEVFPCELKYFRVETFSEGLAAVLNYDGKWGFIDKTGKEVISCTYKNVESFSNGRAKVTYNSFSRKDNVRYIDKTGKEVLLIQEN